MPSSSGWITADNVNEYFGEDGNWIGPGAKEALGKGVGRVRDRDEAEGTGGMRSV
jgi:chloride channel, nucleotide-sensitive, 1A